MNMYFFVFQNFLLWYSCYFFYAGCMAVVALVWVWMHL